MVGPGMRGMGDVFDCTSASSIQIQLARCYVSKVLVWDIFISGVSISGIPNAETLDANVHQA